MTNRQENIRGRIDPLRNDISVSFEFFPPATEKAEQTLWSSIKELEPLAPRFVSVTYGAGGSTRERTHATVARIVRETSLKAAAHLTCVGAEKAQVDEVVRGYQEAGIRHIVALRGDPQGGAERFSPHPGGYASSVELIRGIRQIGDFEISVATYPETHPDATSASADIDFLKRKIDAGATRAISQFFFEAETFLRYLDRVRDAGIEIPVVPGILPLTNFKRAMQFADQCGTRVPDWLGTVFDGLDQQPKIRELVAASVTAELCTQLKDAGIREFHFFTLNRCELTEAICRLLGVRTAQPRG